MSEENAAGRLSQIFDSLTNLPQQQQQQKQPQKHQNLQQQLQQQYQQQQQQHHQYHQTKSQHSPKQSGCVGIGTGAGHHKLYSTGDARYFQRYEDASHYMHTFPSVSQHSHYSQMQQQQSKLLHGQEQPELQSLSLAQRTSQSLNASPLLAKRATSFIDNLCFLRAASTPNSPRPMPRHLHIQATAAPSCPSVNSKRSTASENLSCSGYYAPMEAEAVAWPQQLSILTDHLDVHQVNNYGQPLPEINWQERCLELQLELHRSKNQAGRIRDMLREKLTELEQRVVVAEERATEAEDKVKAMEQRLSEWPQVTKATTKNQQQTDITNSSKAIYNKQQQQKHLQQQSKANSIVTKPPPSDAEKNTKIIINSLETQVEEQRQLRLHDARQVEVKAAKIKEWVNNKLRELEEQNQLLREQNLKCNQQLELLRNHIANNQSCRNNINTAGGTSNSVRNSLSLDVPDYAEAHNLSEISRRHSESLDLQNNIEGRGILHSKLLQQSQQQQPQQNLLKMESQELERNLMAAVDDLTLTPLTMNINNSNSNTNENRQTSSSDTDTAHDYAEIYTPSCEKLPAWLRGNLPAAIIGEGNSSATTTLSDVGVPRRPPTPPLHRFPSWEAKIYQVANDGLATSGTDDEKQHTHTHNQLHLSPTTTTTTKSTRESLKSAPNTLERNEQPIHSRYINLAPGSSCTLSSKNSEYVANATATSAANDVGGTTPNTPQLSTRQQQTASGGFCDISVPVYATVKGRASQIRSVPFTGDSSDDSSDGEDHAVMLTQNSHNSSSTDNTETSTSGSASSPSKSLKTSSSLSPSKRSGSESPNNNKPRVLTDDYALPPDAVSESTCMDASMPSLLMRQSYVDSPSKKLESLEKAGHLAKLGGKLKTWRKRWFVLKNGTLCYWKTQNDVNRKPQGIIMLDDACRINRAEGAATFEIDTGNKVYYLTADSNVNMDDWIRVLQNVQRRNATKLLLSRDDKKSTVEGWLTKVKNGHAKKCWGVLLGKMFLYFKAPNETNPSGQINMRDARVEEVEHASDSDSEESDDISHSQAHLTIAIYPAHQGPTYLILPSKQERDNWLYHLTVVSGGGPSAGTQYEQLVQKLMETNGDPNCVVWRHPILLHTKETISSPLTSVHSEIIQTEAIKLFKSIQLFLSVAINQPGVDYHVVLAQNALQHCLDVPELQTEMICILIKQTSRHTGQKLSVGVQVNKKLGKQTRQLLLCATQSLFTCDLQSGSAQTNGSSPTSIQTSIPAPIIDCKSNPPAYTFIQGWQLLSLAISLFLPKSSRLLWYLKVHLSRNADTKTDTGKYAAYCERALERTLKNGGRETKPSRMEVLSLLLKNPYHHSLPHAIPVHLMNGTYQVISFDGSTTIEEFQCTLAHEIGTRNNTNGFCLFSDDPIEKDLEHYLDPMAKLGDVISKWETALREKGSGKFENTRVIQLTYKNRLYWKNSIKFETDKERLLLCYQTNAQIVQGRFPLSRDLAIELASLMSQIDMGDYSHEKSRSNGGNAGIRAIDNFYPYRYRDAYNAEQLKELQELLLSKWMLLRGRSTLDCVRIYLTCCRKWSFFGATLFQAKPRHSDQAIAWLAVSEDALNVLDLSSMAPVAHYPYGNVMTFGGCQEDFMLVVSNEMAATGSQIQEQKLLFAMSKPKIFEITLLIADYMNALGHTVPGTPQMTTLTRNGSHRSLRSQRPGVGASNLSNTFGTNTACMYTNATSTAHNTLNSHVTHATLNSMHTNTLNSNISTHYQVAASGNNSHYGSGQNTINSLHSDQHTQQQQQQQHQPDILKSTPDHQRIK